MQSLVNSIHILIKKIQEEAGTLPVVIPNQTENLEKIIALCCKLSRDVWISNASNVRGNTRIYVFTQTNH